MGKARSTCESMAQHTSPSSFRAPGDSDEHRPTPWFCPSGRLLLPNSVVLDALSLGQNLAGWPADHRSGAPIYA
jgi:uncharacterized protein YceK